LALAALPVAALVLVSGCGSEEPEVIDPTTSADPGDAAPTTTDAQETTEATETTEEPATTTEEPTTTDAPSTTDDGPPAEGVGDAMTFAEEYVELVASGDTEQAYAMLSPEAMAYFPDASAFEENGVAQLSADLAEASGEPEWAIRSAYEETHDSAQVVSIWGEGGDGEPFAHSF